MVDTDGPTLPLSRSGPWIFLGFIRSIIALSEKLKSPFMETLHVLSVILNPAGTYLH